MRVLVVVVLSLMVFPVAASADNGESGIALVKFSELKELLLERVFAQKGNEGLRKQYLEIQDREKNSRKEMMDAVKSGNFDPLEYATEELPGMFQDEEKIEDLAKAELVRIIEKLYPEKFKLIMNDSYGSDILYTSILVPDITSNIKQYLLKEKVKVE